MTDDTRTLTLSDFLLARIAEVEAAARAFIACEWAGVDAWGEGAELFFGDYAPASPVGVLAKCEADRQIVGACSGWDSELDNTGVLAATVLRALALPYAEHADYQEEWRG